jgi:hypothetical protein
VAQLATLISEKGVNPRFIAFLETRKVSTAKTHIFWQNPDLPNPQNPHPICALHISD